MICSGKSLVKVVYVLTWAICHIVLQNDNSYKIVTFSIGPSIQPDLHNLSGLCNLEAIKRLHCFFYTHERPTIVFLQGRKTQVKAQSRICFLMTAWAAFSEGLLGHQMVSLPELLKPVVTLERLVSTS